MNSKYLIFTTIALLFVTSHLFGYGYLPVVKSFDKSQYGAGRQNWDIDIDSHGVVYFGNSSGLLRNIFGIWQLNTTDNDDLIRSLDIQNDTIWCGGSVDVGYFTKNSPDDLNYTRIGDVGTGSAWNTICTDDKVYFQTEAAIIIYDKSSQELKRIGLAEGFYGISYWRNQIWALTRENKLGVIDGDSFVPRMDIDVFQGVEVRKLFVFKKKLNFLLFDGRMFSYNGEKALETQLPASVAGKAFFTVDSYDKNSYCLGTISDGLQIVDDDKKEVIYRVTSENNLMDNTVLSLKKDRDGNVWLGLDYGIAYVETMNTIKPIFDRGATYSIAEHNNQTFLATNKGLFSDYSGKEFKLVPGSQGQVWRMHEFNSHLYIGHNIGLLKYANGRITQLFDQSGVLDVAHFTGTNRFLIATYENLYFAKEENSTMQIIKSIDHSGVYKLVTDETNECIWGVSVSGLTRFFLEDNTELISKDQQGVLNVFKSEEQMFFYDGTKLLEYKDNGFRVLDKRPFNTITGENISTMSMGKNGNILAYVQNDLPKMMVRLYDGNFHSYEKMLSSVQRNLVANHEFIDLKGSELRIATDRGVVTFNPESGSAQAREVLPVIKKFELTNNESKHLEYIYPFMDKKISLDAGDKDVLFHFGINKSSADAVEYRYQLWPYDKAWSEWDSRQDSKSYTRLKGGDYEFRLESRLNGTIVNNDVLVFAIERLWYQTELVFLMYFGIFLVCLALTVFVMKRITSVRIKIEKTRHGQAVTEKTLSIKNEQLLQYAEVIGKKNQFLMEVKDGLSRMRNSDAKRWERKILDEVNNEKKNFFFHKLFSELHQDFINRLTEKHPNLTPHDVRILSFIRINLDTTEIANLLNISPRSVDINRYRIRKKLNLPHEADLNVYIREL